jgi:hypothetical protein
MGGWVYVLVAVRKAGALCVGDGVGGGNSSADAAFYAATLCSWRELFGGPSMLGGGGTGDGGGGSARDWMNEAIPIILTL